MSQEASVCRAHDLFPKQPAQKCEKSFKGSCGVGGGNGGSPQSKQVGLKPACPSFQPATAKIRRTQTLKPSGGKNRTGPAKHARIRLQIGPRPERCAQSSMTGNSNKCLKLHLSHNLLRQSYNEPAGDMNTVIFPSHDYT